LSGAAGEVSTDYTYVEGAIAMTTEPEADTYRLRLVAMLTRLDQDRGQIEDEAMQGTGGEASGGLSDVPLHLADLGNRECEEGITLGLLESRERLIAEINGALERIDQGVFGRCQPCGHKIAKSRLEALPYARYCVRCARKSQGTAAPLP
jgi:DnaK suppressor protein